MDDMEKEPHVCCSMKIPQGTKWISVLQSQETNDGFQGSAIEIWCLVMIHFIEASYFLDMLRKLDSLKGIDSWKPRAWSAPVRCFKTTFKTVRTLPEINIAS